MFYNYVRKKTKKLIMKKNEFTDSCLPLVTFNDFAKI